MKALSMTLALALTTASALVAQDGYDRQTPVTPTATWEATIRGVSG